MSNSIPQYTQVRNCTLPPWDLYKINKFADKSTGSRLSSIKACAKGNSTANSTFKGNGMGGSSAAGFSNVQTSGGRTSRLASLVSRHSKNEKKKFETQRLLREKERNRKKKNKK